MKNRHRILRPKRFRLTLLAMFTCFAVIGALTVAPAGAEVNPVEVENFGNNSGSSSSQFGSDNNDDDDEEDDDPSSNNSSNNNSGSSVTTAQQAANEFSNGDTGGEFGTTADPASDPDPNANNSSVGGFGSDNNDPFSNNSTGSGNGATAQQAADTFANGDLDGEFGSTENPAGAPGPALFGGANGQNETLGGTVSAPNSGNSLTVSYLNDGGGNTGLRVDFSLEGGFASTGQINIGGSFVSVEGITPNDEGGVTNTTINGVDVMVTVGRDVGVGSVNGGAVVSVELTSQEVENEGSSSSTQTTSTNVGGVVNVTIPGLTVEGQVGVGFQTQVGQSVTQDPNRPNVVIISETTNSGLIVTGTFEAQFVSTSNPDQAGIGLAVGEATQIGEPTQLTGTQITQSTAIDMSTGEVLEQMIVVEEPGPFGQPGVGIGLTPDALTIFNIDGTGTTSNISTAVPVPPPPTSIHGNPFEVVDDAEDTPEALPAFDGSRAPCVDSDGDGFGWDGTQTCRPTSNTNTATPAVQATPAPACVDSDGDGFGWDGFQTCVPGASNIVSNAVQAGAAVVAGPACVDSDGDGWGWDGTQSCRI